MASADGRARERRTQPVGSGRQGGHKVGAEARARAGRERPNTHPPSPFGLDDNLSQGSLRLNTLSQASLRLDTLSQASLAEFALAEPWEGTLTSSSIVLKSVPPAPRRRGLRVS